MIRHVQWRNEPHGAFSYFRQAIFGNRIHRGLLLTIPFGRELYL
jgi:hypothetical protein